MHMNLVSTILFSIGCLLGFGLQITLPRETNHGMAARNKQKCIFFLIYKVPEVFNYRPISHGIRYRGFLVLEDKHT